MGRIRLPAVAGAFYPADPVELRLAVGRHLAGAHGAALEEPLPKALIAPHAGYIFSGPVAASAYAHLEPARGRIRRVVLLGPAHRVPVRGLAVPHADAFETPLGLVSVDREAVERLAELPQVEWSDDACGRHPVRGLLLAARRRGLTCRIVDLRSSGDTAGPRDRVVGYGSYVLA